MSFAEDVMRKKNLGGVEYKYAADEEWSDKKAECEGFKAKFGLLLCDGNYFEGLLLKEGKSACVDFMRMHSN